MSTLREAIAIGEAAWRAADQGDWDEVHRLAPERDLVLRRLLGQLSTEGELERLLPGLGTLVALDNRLITLATAEQRRRGEEVREKSGARRASRAYREVGR